MSSKFGRWWHDLPLGLKILGIGAGAAGAFFGAPAAAGALGMGASGAGAGAAGAAGAGAGAGGMTAGTVAPWLTGTLGAETTAGLAVPTAFAPTATAASSPGFFGSLGAFASKHPGMMNYGKGVGQDYLSQLIQSKYQKPMMQPNPGYNAPGQWKAYAGRDTLGELMASMRSQYGQPMWTQREQQR